MKYHTYWSILDASTNSIKSHHVLFGVSLVLIIFWIAIKYFLKKGIENTVMLWVLGIFAGTLFSFAVYLKYFTVDHTTERINDFLASDQVSKVEGIVSRFSRKYESDRRQNETIESFYVDSVQFSYDNNQINRFKGFGKVKNGVLYNGVQVRISYLKGDNYIQKIEIGEQ